MREARGPEVSRQMSPRRGFKLENTKDRQSNEREFDQGSSILIFARRRGIPRVKGMDGNNTSVECQTPNITCVKKKGFIAKRSSSLL